MKASGIRLVSSDEAAIVYVISLAGFEEFSNPINIDREQVQDISALAERIKYLCY